jgi:poly [ADP-ribose] polymerase
MATLVEKHHLNMTNQSGTNNNNKFWNIEIFDDGDTTVTYGRQGDDGQTSRKSHGSLSSAQAFANKMIRSKNKKGYLEISVVDSATITKSAAKNVSASNLESIAQNQIRSNNPNVVSLISYLTKVNAHNISNSTGGQITFNDTTGLFSTVQGVVGQDVIDQANDILVKIGDSVAKGKYNDTFDEYSNQYLSLIPQDFGRRKLNIKEFWADVQKVQSQKQILDSLQASLVTATSAPKTKKTVKTPEEQVFDVQLDLVECGKTIDRIKKKYHSSRQSAHACHHLDVKKVYSVDINTVSSAFAKDGKNCKNVWELFHGTRASNLLSILKGGLMMPSASSTNVTGKMFSGYPGKEGLYFSDQSTKSLNYAYGYWGGKQDNNCFMFLADVAMEDYYVPTGPSDGPFPKRGYDSTFAKARKSNVNNNEMIVYGTSKINLTYLIEFSPNGR